MITRPSLLALVVIALACLTTPRSVLAVCGDNVADLPVEACDGTDDFSCPGLCIPPGEPFECFCGLPVCGDGVVSDPEECDGAEDAACANGCAQDCNCQQLDHYQCYEIKPAAFASREVTVQDTFGSLALRVRFPHRLCAPASKNDEGVVDEISHLTGYTVRVPFARQRDRRVDNQFGDLRLDVLRPDIMMVPTEKNGVAIPPGNDLDHFQCYKVKRTSGADKFTPVEVTVADQFGTETVRVLRPFRLCVAANKNGEDPTAPNHRDHLLCYKTRAPFGTTDVTIANQFGDDAVRLIQTGVSSASLRWKCARGE